MARNNKSNKRASTYVAPDVAVIELKVEQNILADGSAPDVPIEPY